MEENLVQIIDISDLDIKNIDKMITDELTTAKVFPKSPKSQVGSIRSKSSMRSKSTSRSQASTSISTNLLKTTASFQKRIESKEEEQPEDIWYSERNAKILAIGKQNDKNKYEHVSSKLYETTKSTKLKTVKEEKDDIIHQLKAISPQSRILQPTQSFVSKKELDDTKSEMDTSVPITEARSLSRKTGPKVESRLWETTSAMKSSKWKSKADLEAEEQIKIEMELEERAKQEQFKVLRPSERLLMPTLALEHAKYSRKSPEDSSSPSSEMFIRDDRSEISSTPSAAKKVRETSSSLLRLTAANINATYKPPESPTWSPKAIATTPVAIRDHLIAPTAALENAKYKRKEEDIDPRELGWKSYGRKMSDAVSVISEKSDMTHTPKSVKKVRETSERLLALKDHQVWKGPADLQLQAETKKLTKIKPISPTDHLLKPKEVPTTPKPEDEVKVEKKKITKPSDHLLTLTAALEHSRYVKPEDRVSVEDNTDDISETLSQGPTYKVKETSERLLSLTAAYQNHRKPTPEPPKELPKAVTSNEHFLIPTISYRISTTISSSKPKGRVAFQIPQEDATASSTVDNDSEPRYVQQVSSSAHFLAPTASFIHRVEGSDGVYNPTNSKLRRKNSVTDLWMDAISHNGSTASVRSVSPSVSSMSSHTTLSSVSVKNLVQVFSVRSVSNS